MPTDDALRFDEDKMPTPVAAAEGADRNPEQFVLGAETRSLPSRPGQYGELMAEQEILGHEHIAVAHGGTDKAEENKQVLEHRPNIMPLRACSRPGQLLHPHRWTRSWGTLAIRWRICESSISPAAPTAPRASGIRAHAVSTMIAPA